MKWIFFILFIITNLTIITYVITSIYLRFSKARDIKIREQIINFPNYHGLLEYYMLRAYTIIYQDRILVYSMEPSQLPKHEYENATKAFGTLVLKMVGPRITEELVSFYGNIDTLLFVITEYFNERYENDEIRKTNMNQIMEQDGISAED